MFGDDKTYFADSPVVIDISGLQWPGTSPFNIVRVFVDYNSKEVGKFHCDTGGQSTATFDISSALVNIWADYDFDVEIGKAQEALGSSAAQSHQRAMRKYTLRIYTEYMSSDGVFTTTQCQDAQGHTDIPGGQCLIGAFTEWERSLITEDRNRDVSHLEHTGVRNGDASTKPTDSPELIGIDSITSWTDVQDGYTKSIFYPSSVSPQDDDIPGMATGWTGHAPIVLRDSIQYQDFLFVNRRGAIETCSGQTLEAMNIDVDTKQYNRVERPSFTPSRSLMTISSGTRRSWQMSSGFQTRNWAEWWEEEFIPARQKWMRYRYTERTHSGTVNREKFVPVIVEPAKKSTSIYDRTKQQMPHVDFTVTLALEG